MDKRNIRIGIVAGEPSGDSLGAGLINALRLIYPNACFFGIGGPKMREVQCETLYDMDRIGLMGFDGLVDKLGDILKIRKSLYRNFRSNPPDLFVGIDVPDFNLSLERKLKKINIPVVHYVSPTVWAWRGYRIHKIRRSIDLMLTLFPFEADYYQRNNIPVACVGHPIADEIDEPNKLTARRSLGLDLNENSKLIGLLPGSRRSEVSKLGAIFVESVEMLSQSDPNLHFVLPFANPQVEKTFYDVAGAVDHLPVTVLSGQSRTAIEASDIVILASGTAALEAALLRRPHVVVYKLSPITFWFFQKLRHVDYYSMPNQLLPKPDVPEFVQENATAANIVDAANQYLKNPDKVKKLEAEFSKVHKALKLDANLQASRAIARLLDARL